VIQFRGEWCKHVFTPVWGFSSSLHSPQLLARIERMERRLQLTKKDPRDKRLFQPLEPWTPDKDDMWDLETDEGPPSEQATPLSFGRGGKGQKR